MPQESKQCSICHQTKPLILFTTYKYEGRWLYYSYCRACNSKKRHAYYVKNKDKYKDWFKEWWKDKTTEERASIAARYKKQHKSHQAIARATRKGTFKKLPCNECGEAKTEFHHTNGYEKENWFVGVWLCRQCHAKLHKALREEKRLWTMS